MTLSKRVADAFSFAHELHKAQMRKGTQIPYLAHLMQVSAIVIEHGGIFVSTYRIPKLGVSVQLRVLLPGDYEFYATAIVQWTREASGSSEPGFGARFTQIGSEGRQLVYRYARNREPMFYDDL